MIRVLSSSTLLLALGCGAALAQEPNNSRETDEVDASIELTVYGEGLNRTVQETPTSVAVISSAVIDDANFDDYFDALRRVANVSSNNGELNFNIRGINNNTNQTGGATAAGQPVSGVYIDGLLIPADAFSLNLFAGAQSTWDVEQLEIYRGVQLTRGRQTPVGSIYIETKRPTDQLEVDARALLASYNTVNSAVAISGPVFKPLDLTGRLSVEVGHTDGAVDNTFRNVDDHDSKDILNVRGKLRWAPSFWPNFEATATLASYNFDTGLDAIPLEIFLLEDHGDRRKAVIDTIERREYEMSVAQLNASWKASDHLLLDLMIGYNDAYENTYAEIDYSNEATYGNSYREFPDEEIFATELRGRYDYGFAYGAVGFYYEHVDSTYNLFYWGGVTDPRNNPFPGAPSSRTVNNKDTKTASVYGDLFVPLFNEFVTLGGGLRLQRFENETRIGAVAADSDPVFEQTTVSPKASVQLKWSDEFSSTLSAARGSRPGYRSSYLDTSPGAAPGSIAVFEADEEQLWNYEAAFRFKNDRLTANANLFYIDWSNQIGVDSNGRPANLGGAPRPTASNSRGRTTSPPISNSS